MICKLSSTSPTNKQNMRFFKGRSLSNLCTAMSPLPRRVPEHIAGVYCLMNDRSSKLLNFVFICRMGTMITPAPPPGPGMS